MAADFTFESEFEDSVSKSAAEAAKATRLLAREVGSLGKEEAAAARHALKLAGAHERMARAADRAARLERELASEIGSVSVRARQDLSVAKNRLRLARAQAALIARQSAIKPGTGGLPLPATLGIATLGAASLAGWLAIINSTVSLIGAGIQRSIDFTGAVHSAAVFNESMRFSFKTLTGDGEAAFQKTRELSLLLGEDLQNTGERMRRLLAQKFTLNQSEGLLKMLADLRLVGVEGEKADRVLMALTQIKAKGRLQAEEMLQLAEAGVSIETVYSELGKKLGKTRQELEKMQKAGKVTSEMALDAVQAASLQLVNKKKAGEAGSEFIETTLSGMTKRLQSTKSIALSDIADDAMPTFRKLGPIVRDVSKELTNPALRGKLGNTFSVLGELLDRQGPKFGQDFANGLSIAADAFDRIVKLGTSFVDGFMDGFRPFLRELGVDGVANVDGLAESMRVFGAAGGSVLGDLLVKGNSFLGTLNSIATKVNEILDVFSKDKTQQGRALGSSFVDGMQGSLLAGIPVVGGAAALLGAAIDAGARGPQGIDAHSPSRKAHRTILDYQKGFLSARGDMSAKAGADLGASLNLGARQGVFAGSPAHRAITNNTNRSRTNVNVSQQNSFHGMGPVEATATAKASLFDLSAIAKASFEVG